MASDGGRIASKAGEKSHSPVRGPRQHVVAGAFGERHRMLAVLARFALRSSPRIQQKQRSVRASEQDLVSALLGCGESTFDFSFCRVEMTEILQTNPFREVQTNEHRIIG